MVAVANPVMFIPEKRPPVAGGRRFEIVSEFQFANEIAVDHEEGFSSDEKRVRGKGYSGHADRAA